VVRITPAVIFAIIRTLASASATSRRPRVSPRSPPAARSSSRRRISGCRCPRPGVHRCDLRCRGRVPVRLGALGRRRPAGTGLDGHPARGSDHRCTRYDATRAGTPRRRSRRADALELGTRVHPSWTTETHPLALNVATANRHPGRCPAERQSWQSRHLVQKQSSSKQTAADEVGRRMRPAVIIDWTPPRVSSTSGSCGPILTAPSMSCAPVAAVDGSDARSGWGVAAHL
jgi:hypothetical protein